MENKLFWETLEKLVRESEIKIDRKKGSFHPRYPEIQYEVDYGYLKGTTSMDKAGIDVWKGSKSGLEINGIICTVDLWKRDSEIKILLNCTEEEIQKINSFHNRSDNMKGILIRR